MRIHLVLCLLGLFLAVSCGSKPHYPEGGTNADRMGMSVYENEFYSVRYPAHWAVKADIRDKYEGYEKFAGSYKITLRKHEVDLVNTDGVSFHIVKSNFRIDMSVEKYADLSILTKGFPDAGKYQAIIDRNLQKDSVEYLSFWRNDSISFDGRRAVLLAFEALSAQKDTMIQKQVVVQNNHGDTFYVNSTFYKGDTFAETIGDDILNTFRLK